VRNKSGEQVKGGIKKGSSDPAAKYLHAAILLVGMIICSCTALGDKVTEGRSITDSTGRRVVIPDTVNSVIALKSGTMRLLSYMRVTHLVSHIEGSEQRRTVPYLFANPHLRELPVIGAGNNYDPELLAAAQSDIIIATYLSGHEADRLQRITGKPVILLDYGDLGDGKENLFSTINLLGEIFRKEERSDSLVNYIRETMSEVAGRAERAGESIPEAYIGGVAYNGAHGITSTEPDYPPFRMLSVKHVAAGDVRKEKKNVLSHEVLFTDREQLIEWNPHVLFLDAAGRQIWEEEIAEEVMATSLDALKENRVWTVLPYNWNTTNYENLLCNVWYIGYILMPSSFSDIDYIEKSREIFLFFHGTDIWDEVNNYYMPFRQITNLAAE
jgi:iron complex transport system substrate-binding protein